MKKDKDKEKKKKRDRRVIEEVPVLAPDPVPMADHPDPLACLNDFVGGKWKLRILWALREKTSKRYGQLKAEISGITDMMLSQSLREMTACGLVLRRQYQEIPPRVEYEITPMGAELLPALNLLAQWTLKNCAEKSLNV